MPADIIQIIEDDPQHAQLLDHTLRRAGFRTNVAHHGTTGLEDVRRLHPALVLLDIMLPELDGHEVCRRLRADPDTKATPIIMLSALAGEDHRTMGLNLGADDYIPKPFSPREVVSRIRAVLRRSQRHPAGRDVYLGGEGLLLEGTWHRILFRGRSVELSDPEWRILQILAVQPGRTVMRKDLVALLWEDDGLIHDQELERHLRALDRKLQAGAEGSLILMTPGFGYQLRPARS